ncbi:hypothetical protein [Clostridium grantii]|uniref:Uncharacterized protein n=1 Tax=Clostridium grantii DSM 8605 TaxID=1121316 RepID=A0A1M5UPD5_9CLOT|nr:hypothetical protein [Clostridium grantii]SHH64533.1 hypothetical protein SAMN02745207_01846 [Clostridium grantii DSM 8605]
MSYYRNGFFGTLINSILIIGLVYLIIRGLVILIPIGIVVWGLYRVYKYIANINFNKKKVKDDPDFSKVEDNKDAFDYDVNDVIDVDYESINK